jgi:hypothetical protein
MTTRVLELWDRPRLRGTVIALALAMLFAGSVALYAQQHRYVSPPTNSQPNPSPFFRDGKTIAVPQAATRTMTTFIRDAVLREDLDAAWRESTGRVRGGLTHAQWMTGAIPVAPFGKGSRFDPVKTVESRAKRVWIELLVTPKHFTPGAEGGEYFIQLVPRNGAWLVDYWGPKGWNPPVPAAGGQ